MKRLADQFGKGDTFHLTPVGVFFGRDGAQEPGVDGRPTRSSAASGPSARAASSAARA